MHRSPGRLMQEGWTFKTTQPGPSKEKGPEPKRQLHCSLNLTLRISRVEAVSMGSA